MLWIYYHGECRKHRMFVCMRSVVLDSLALCTWDLIKKYFFLYFLIRKREHNCKKELKFIIIHDCAVGWRNERRSIEICAGFSASCIIRHISRLRDRCRTLKSGKNRLKSKTSSDLPPRISTAAQFFPSVGEFITEFPWKWKIEFHSIQQPTSSSHDFGCCSRWKVGWSHTTPGNKLYAAAILCRLGKEGTTQKQPCQEYQIV